jgi:sugar/nucleoside kinase (ribokinase family)
MKILGIGNAIVDVICKVSDEFLENNSLTKSTMKLVNEDEFKNLISSLKIEETISGGSVANSVVGLSQLGNKVGFLGKVSDDDLGQKYEDGLIKENVEYLYSKKKEPIPTGSCLILITPESGKDDGKDNKDKKDDNVVDADFEEVKDENKEKSA